VSYSFISSMARSVEKSDDFISLLMACTLGYQDIDPVTSFKEPASTHRDRMIKVPWKSLRKVG
jgi:hypothetical protein